MKVGKPKSKRVPVRLRHKIEKASAAKQRKQRKEAKKNPEWRSRLKKDPGIPNLFPYKDKVLAEIEESKRKREEETLRRRELAKAQRQGLAVADTAAPSNPAANDNDEDEDEALIDPEDDLASASDDAMDEDEKNPMAALLASAQARAQTFGKGVSAGDQDVEEDEEEEEDEGQEWAGVSSAPNKNPRVTRAARDPEPAAVRKTLPRQALEDPLKAVTTLLERLQRTHDGVQRLLDHYAIPPLVTAGSDETTRFLVEVARKRGRLGRGGVPNLPAAALLVLGDLLEGRLVLPSAAPAAVGGKGVGSGAGEGKARIVTKMAEPFRIEGLFGEETVGATGMEVEA